MRVRSLTATFIALVAAALVVVAAALAWVVVRQADDSRRQRGLSDVLRRTMELNEQLRADLDAQTTLVYRYLDSRERALVQEYEELHFAVGERQVSYLRMDIGDVERAHVARIRDLQEEMALRGAMAMQAADDRSPVASHLARMEQSRSELNGVFERLSALQAAKLDSALSGASERVEATYRVMLAVVGMLGLVLLAMAALLRHRVQRPLADLLAAARKIRDGDLTVRARGESVDEVGRVATEFNFMAQALEDSYAGLEHKVEERTAEIRALQEQLVEAERMSAMGQLVSGVAHELSNPLTTILGFAEIERRERGADPRATPGPGRSALDEIVHQAERSRRIVGDLLQFARRRGSELEHIDLCEVVAHTLRARSVDVETRGIRILHEHDDARPIVHADPYKVEQLMVILLDNAVDAIRGIGASGTITVATGVQGDRAILQVSDTGPGIREPQRVFEPFYTTKEIGHGTGLGLSVAHGIVSEHRGEIRAENRERGARLTIEFPLADEQGPVEALTDPGVVADDTARAATGRLLIVEDDRSVRLLQQRIAEGMGVDVETVESGDAAIQAMMRRDFDAVLCDVRMPGTLDGPAVYEWISEHRPALARHFAFVSGDTGRAGEGLPAPHIHKPFGFAEYERILTKILERAS